MANGTRRWYFDGAGRDSGLETRRSCDWDVGQLRRHDMEVCVLLAALLKTLAPAPTSALAFDGATLGVREILLAGSVIGIGVVLIAWGVLARKRDVPGHARDSAEKLTRDLIDELENRAERLEKLISRAESTLVELRDSERRIAAAPKRVVETIIEPKPRQEHSIFTDPMHNEVCALAEQGLGPVDIARRMQLPTGQVELILNLRPNRAVRRD